MKENANSLARVKALFSSHPSIFSSLISHDFSTCTQQSRCIRLLAVPRMFPYHPLSLEYFLLHSWQLASSYSPLLTLLRLTFIRIFTNFMSYTSGIFLFSLLPQYTKPDLFKEQDVVAWATVSTSQWLDHQLDSQCSFWRWTSSWHCWPCPFS